MRNFLIMGNTFLTVQAKSENTEFSNLSDTWWVLHHWKERAMHVYVAAFNELWDQVVTEICIKVVETVGIFSIWVFELFGTKLWSNLVPYLRHVQGGPKFVYKHYSSGKVAEKISWPIKKGTLTNVDLKKSFTTGMMPAPNGGDKMSGKLPPIPQSPRL